MRILILHTSAGGGHTSVAKALEEQFKEEHPDIEVKNVDVLDYTSAVYKDLYAGGYASLIHFAPKVWGQLYDFTDKQNQATLRNKMISFFDRLNSQKLIKLIKDFQPDHIISTHFFSTGVLQMQRNRKIKQIPHSAVITDYDMHALWVKPNVKYYFVATEMVKWSLIHKMKVIPENIFVTGIPVRSSFMKDGNKRQDVFESLNLDQNLKTILVLSGGLGIGKIAKVVDHISRIEDSMNLVVVCGKNDKLRRSLTRKKYGRNIHKKVLGYTDEMADLMHVADLAVTKAGGLTVTECIVRHCPMIVVAPIPGQEEINTDYVQEQGVGLEASDLVELEYKVRYLLEHPEKLSQMRKRCADIARPMAAREVVSKVVEL